MTDASLAGAREAGAAREPPRLLGNVFFGKCAGWARAREGGREVARRPPRAQKQNVTIVKHKECVCQRLTPSRPAHSLSLSRAQQSEAHGQGMARLLRALASPSFARASPRNDETFRARIMLIVGAKQRWSASGSEVFWRGRGGLLSSRASG